MSTANNELIAFIDKMVTEKTFSFEALEAIKVLKDKASQLDLKLESTKAERDEYKRRLTFSEDQVNLLRAEVSVWTKRESELVTRERKIFENEKSTAVANAQYQGFREMASMVFKNTIVREGICKSNSMPVSVNGYVQQQTTSETYNKDTTTVPDNNAP